MEYRIFVKNVDANNTVNLCITLLLDHKLHVDFNDSTVKKVLR